MSERGLNPFVRAFIYFLRSFKRNPARNAKYIGKDHMGNKFFEIKDDKNDKTIRYFEAINVDHFDELSPEWNAWLRKRRIDPPTLEESMMNFKRIEKFKNQPTLSDQPKKTPEKSEKNFPYHDEYEETPGSKYKPS